MSFEAIAFVGFCVSLVVQVFEAVGEFSDFVGGVFGDALVQVEVFVEQEEPDELSQ